MPKAQLPLPENILRKLRKRTWSERSLLFISLWRLALARFAVLVIPFRRIAPSLGIQGHTASTKITASQTLDAVQIGRAVRAVARHTPWNSNCLAQAIAAKRMLQHRSIPSTLYLGVRKSKDATDNLNAHAWLACGDHILTGKGQHQEFTIVSQFGDEG